MIRFHALGIWFVAVSAFFLSAAVPARAGIADCLRIEGAMERLACYDKEAGFAPQVTITQGTGKWRVREEVSKIDDSRNVFLTLDSSEQTSCRYKSGAHRLWIACRENTTSLWVTFGGCFMSSNQGKGRVTYRVDQDKAQSRAFRESNSNQALGLWSGGEAIPFLTKMLGASRLILRATPFSDSTVTGEYDISGIDTAIEPLRAACNW